MRALVLEDFGRLALQQRPVPAIHQGEALIRVSYTGICGSDIHGYTGHNGRRSIGQVMGHESSGTVEALAPGSARGLAIGDRVTFNPVVVPLGDRVSFLGREQHSPSKSVIGVDPARDASFADFVVVPEGNVVRLPDHMPIEHGALVEPIAVALHAVRRADVQAQHSVLVVGGGPIGQSVVVALLALGVRRIVVSEPNAARRGLLAAMPVVVIDPTVHDVVLAVEQQGGPVDVAIDAVGSSRSLSDALRCTALGGTVCLVGMGEPQVAVDAFQISTAERAVVGSFTYSADDFIDAVDVVAQNAAVIGSLISRIIGPEDADDAFSGLARGDDTAGKVLVGFHTTPVIRVPEQERA